MNKLILSIAVLLSCNLWAMAQANEGQKKSSTLSLSFEYEDRCGNPLVESQLWQSFKGTALKVVDGDTITVLTEVNKRKRVKLAAVDASSSKNAARLMLSKLVLSRQVEVLVNPDSIESEKVSGVVFTPGHEINRELIKAGAAKYKEPKRYGMSGYTACVYKIIESEAREAKRGLWQSAISR